MRRLVCWLIVASALVPSRSAAQSVEHVVVVLLDDVGVDKVAAYGLHPTAGPTPLLDALAADGVIFTRAYADPVCAASRAAALTGRYGSRTGVSGAALGPATGPPDPRLFAPADDLPWLPRILARNGVRSTAVGKWHLTHKGVPAYQMHPVSVGFERFAGSIFNLGGDGGSYKDWLKTTATVEGWRAAPSTTYATADTTAEGLAFLLDAAPSRSFLWLALNATHAPLHIPPFGTYSGPPPLFAPGQQQAMLEAVEHHLGEMMTAYARAEPEAAARTLWLVTGDNGTLNDAVEPPWDKAHAKGTCYEGGTRVPLIAWGAGVRRPGARCAAPVHIVDVWATVLDALDVAQSGDAPSDSVSFFPALQEPTGFAGRGWAYTRITDTCGFGPFTLRDHAAVDGRWKLVEHLDGSRELYDLETDPLEQEDLWPPATTEGQRAEARLAGVLAASGSP